LTSDASDATVRISDEGWRAAIMVRQTAVPFFLGILHRDLGAAEQHVFEMLQRYGKAGDDGGQVHSFTPVQFRTWNDDSHTYKSELRMTNEE
ncbi:MAG: hypothetical protein DMF22_05150, partial [Verrucomicrobia bacterium]